MKQFGGKATRKRIEKYSESPNWKDGKFQNLEETSMDISIHTMPKLLYKQIFNSAGREPKNAIPVESFDKEKFLASSRGAKFIWYGHSALLLRINNSTIFIDPMLGPNATPIAPFATKRFSNNTLEIIDQLPTIDLLLLTHDHYDHLDLATMQKLMPKVDKYFVALGTSRHFEKWGASINNIEEFDWWDERVFRDLKITFTPSRHFSGRGPTDRAKSLWGGWVIKTPNERIYWSGDGGFGDHFKEVGSRLGPFDIGFMECGQYNPNWHQIHMYPEESVQAALEAGVSHGVAVHWGGFSLAQHTWKEPIEGFVAASEQTKLEILTPEIGALFSLEDNQGLVPWWRDHT